jgi:hypothetical protein
MAALIDEVECAGSDATPANHSSHEAGLVDRAKAEKAAAFDEIGSRPVPLASPEDRLAGGDVGGIDIVQQLGMQWEHRRRQRKRRDRNSSTSNP